MREAYIWQFELFCFPFVISISPHVPHALTVEGPLWNQPDHITSPSMYNLGNSLQLPLILPSHCIQLSPRNSTCHLLPTKHSILHSHKSSKLACLSYIYAFLLKFCGHPEWHRVVPKFMAAVLPQLFVNVYVDLWFGLSICVMTSNTWSYIQHCPTCSTVQTNAVLVLASYSSNFMVTYLWCHTNKSEKKKCWQMFGHILESGVSFKPLYKYSH